MCILGCGEMFFFWVAVDICLCVLQAEVFGSFKTGLYLPSSDIDVSLKLFISHLNDLLLAIISDPLTNILCSTCKLEV